MTTITDEMTDKDKIEILREYILSGTDWQFADVSARSLSEALGREQLVLPHICVVAGVPVSDMRYSFEAIERHGRECAEAVFAYLRGNK